METGGGWGGDEGGARGERMCLYVCERKNNISFYVFLAFDQNFCVFFELHVWHFAPYYGLYMQNRGGFCRCFSFVLETLHICVL